MELAHVRLQKIRKINSNYDTMDASVDGSQTSIATNETEGTQHLLAFPRDQRISQSVSVLAHRNITQFGRFVLCKLKLPLICF